MSEAKEYADEVAEDVFEALGLPMVPIEGAKKASDVIRAAIRKTQEECCKLVCLACSLGVPFAQDADRWWEHADERCEDVADCEAWKIRHKMEVDNE